jgi:hypothetical protein
MNGIWDIKADAVKKGDNHRDVSPLIDKTWKDDRFYSLYF